MKDLKHSVEMTDDEFKNWQTVKLENERFAAAEEAAEELRLKKQKEAKRVSDELLPKFLKAVEQANKEIELHIKEAKASLNKAVAVSEQYGVPFQSDVVEFAERSYTPESFRKYWNGVSLYDESNGYISEFLCYGDFSESGWEYWNSSSLTC